jgi:hypothetical protein
VGSTKQNTNSSYDNKCSIKRHVLKHKIALVTNNEKTGNFSNMMDDRRITRSYRGIQSEILQAAAYFTPAAKLLLTGVSYEHVMKLVLQQESFILNK